MTNDFEKVWDEKFDQRYAVGSFNVEPEDRESLKAFMHSRDFALEAEVKKEIRENAAFKDLKEHQTQIDEDGIGVGVSRQALHEVLALLTP